MAQELNVNEHRRAFQQHKRQSAFGLQDTLDVGQRPDGEPWWKRYFKWETLTVAGRTIEKGWVVPQALGVALIIFMLGTAVTTLGAAAALYWRVTDAVGAQAKETRELREIVIRLDERMIQKDDHDKERYRQLEERMQGQQDHQAAIESLWNKQFSELKAQKR